MLVTTLTGVTTYVFTYYVPKQNSLGAVKKGRYQAK